MEEKEEVKETVGSTDLVDDVKTEEGDVEDTSNEYNVHKIYKKYARNDVGILSTHNFSIGADTNRYKMKTTVDDMYKKLSKNNIREITLPFSGGYDSTLAVVMLYEMSAHYEYRFTLRLVYCDAEFSPTKRVRERAAVDKILRILDKHPGHTNIKRILATPSFAFGAFGNLPNMRLVQQGFWTALMAFFVGDNPDKDAIIFSYIKGDDASIMTDEICQSIHWLTAITKREKRDERKYTILFPILEYPKKQILMDLYNVNPKLLSAAVICEDATHNKLKGIDVKDPKFVCGKCKPCTVLKDTIIQILLSLKPKLKKDIARFKEREERYKNQGWSLKELEREQDELVEVEECIQFFENMLKEKFELSVEVNFTVYDGFNNKKDVKKEEEVQKSESTETKKK